MFVIQKGIVEIWHTQQDILVSELEPETLFGDMSLLGQTMLGCKAIAGSEGARLGVVNVEQVREWIDSNPHKILEELGPRLAHVEADHYRAQFQNADSRVAALLLELAGAESVITGLIHEDLGNQLGMYRETVTNAMNTLKQAGMIEVRRKRITILNKKKLRELSEL